MPRNKCVCVSDRAISHVYMHTFDCCEQARFQKQFSSRCTEQNLALSRRVAEQEDELELMRNHVSHDLI